MPNAIAYIRVSHPEQVESGLSLEAQEQDCQRYWARLLQPKQIAWAKLIADEAVSAFKRSFANRKGGRELLDSVRRGDHVIMTRFDRAFRSMRDFLETYTLFDNMGITLHLMDAPWDYSSANGRAMLQLMAVFAEWSSRIASERIKAAQAILRQQGRPAGGRRKVAQHYSRSCPSFAPSIASSMVPLWPGGWHDPTSRNPGLRARGLCSTC